MDDSRLAVFGGKPLIRRQAKEKWRRISLREIAQITYTALRDNNTVSDGKGPVSVFEERFAQMVGTKYALAMNSGTASLHSAYFALGVGPGDEVIVPGYTFFATTTPILQLGGIPVFADVDPSTLTIDPDDVERLITPRTRAICAVHVWGNPARMDRLLDIAKRHRLPLIEDSSHAPGARFAGRPVGSWGDIGCFSLQGGKAVSGGEAGIATTDDPVLYDRMLALGHNGRTGGGQKANTFPGLDNISFGLKYRPHLYAMLLASGGLTRLPELNKLRNRNYKILREELAGCAAIQPAGTYEGAERGGFLSFLLHYDENAAGGWSREAYVHAAKAEGVPLSVDRYTLFGKGWGLLPDSPLFKSTDLSGLGGVMGRALEDYRSRPAPELPQTRKVEVQLVSLPAFAKVPESYVRDVARALRKVAEAAARIGDVRTPDASSRRSEPAAAPSAPAAEDPQAAAAA
jgi:dTDP-4-amino-4,6-dideoxygalactose transaminase